MKNEIKTIGIITLLYDILGFTSDELMMMSYQDETAYVSSWCRANNYHYYGRPKDEFFEWEGVKEAEEKGCLGVVLENLS